MGMLVCLLYFMGQPRLLFLCSGALLNFFALRMNAQWVFIRETRNAPMQHRPTISLSTVGAFFVCLGNPLPVRTSGVWALYTTVGVVYAWALVKKRYGVQIF